MAVELRKDFAEMMRVHQQDVLELESQRRSVANQSQESSLAMQIQLQLLQSQLAQQAAALQQGALDDARDVEDLRRAREAQQEELRAAVEAGVAPYKLLLLSQAAGPGSSRPASPQGPSSPMLSMVSPPSSLLPAAIGLSPGAWPSFGNGPSQPQAAGFGYAPGPYAGGGWHGGRAASVTNASVVGGFEMPAAPVSSSGHHSASQPPSSYVFQPPSQAGSVYGAAAATAGAAPVTFVSQGAVRGGGAGGPTFAPGPTFAVPVAQNATGGGTGAGPAYGRLGSRDWTPALILYFPFGCLLASARILLWLTGIALDLPGFKNPAVITTYLQLLGVRVVWKHAERVPAGKHVLVSNHCSVGDLMMLFQGLPQRYVHLITTALPERVFKTSNLPVVLLPASADSFNALSLTSAPQQAVSLHTGAPHSAAATRQHHPSSSSADSTQASAHSHPHSSHGDPSQSQSTSRGTPVPHINNGPKAGHEHHSDSNTGSSSGSGSRAQHSSTRSSHTSQTQKEGLASSSSGSGNGSGSSTSSDTTSSVSETDEDDADDARPTSPTRSSRRHAASAAAASHTLPPDAADMPIHLFPEGGMTSGRSGMMSFSRGFTSFAHNLPVVPVALRVTNPLNIRTHTLDSSFAANLFWFSFPPSVRIEATALPALEQGAGEGRAAFVQRLQGVIAEELGFPGGGEGPGQHSAEAADDPAEGGEGRQWGGSSSGQLFDSLMV
ncbi:MAG: hypothetical protein WDW38_008868 [Sanguina aurantia]